MAVWGFWGKSVASEEFENLQRKVREMEGHGKKLKELQDSQEDLDRRVRELNSGSGMNSLVREAIEKIDLELLKKEIIADLKDRLISFGKVEMEAAIKKHDFSADVSIDDDQVLEAIAGKLVSEIKNSISIAKLTEEIARQFIEEDSLDTSEIESRVSDVVADRLSISLKPS